MKYNSQGELLIATHITGGGTISVSNFPTIQPVSGTISVGNFPATQTVSGTVSTGLSQPLTDSQLRASNVGVNVSNFPTIQPVSGTISVGNFPATQPISVASLPLPTGAATNTTLQTVVDRLMPTVGTTVYSALGTSTGANIKNSAGFILNIYCCNLRASIDSSTTNLNSAVRYLQLFDSTSAPSGTPIRSYPIYPNSGVLILGQDFLGGEGMQFTTGITWGISTTPLTYTAATAGETIVNIRYN